MLRALTRTPPASARPLVIGLLVVALLVAWPTAGAAEDTDPRLERAQAQRTEVQERLDALYQRLSAVQADVEELAEQLAGLEDKSEAQQRAAGEASATLAHRVRESYIRGDADPTLTLLVSASADAVQEQARLLGVLALRSRADVEQVTAARVRTEATAEEVAHKHEALAEREAELEELQEDAETALAEAKAEEERVREQIAREERERREREERERREREAREQREREAREREVAQRAARAAPARPGGAGSGGSASSSGGERQASASPSGGIACPVGQPRSYSDTWGAPRSGGRSHKGTDIMAPMGTPIYAYEDGTVTRLWNSSLGGISLYLRGNSGTQYFYTHLQGYVSGLSAGQRVSAGQHIAYNGDTGNARGIPHLHFEVMPGGGSNVNPYPYVVRACG
jgi:peptidoglycan LD-endopeptidase LytH